MKTTSTTMQLLFRMFSAKAHFNIVEKSVHTIDLKNTRRLVLKKKLFFCVGEYAEYGSDQQG